jgi:hypothetical protein
VRINAGPVFVLNTPSAITSAFASLPERHVTNGTGALDLATEVREWRGPDSSACGLLSSVRTIAASANMAAYTSSEPVYEPVWRMKTMGIVRWLAWNDFPIQLLCTASGSRVGSSTR